VIVGGYIASSSRSTGNFSVMRLRQLHPDCPRRAGWKERTRFSTYVANLCQSAVCPMGARTCWSTMRETLPQKCGAMNLSCGPQVISSQQQQKYVAAHLSCLKIPPPHWNFES
jgi:hypothetical protein